MHPNKNQNNSYQLKSLLSNNSKFWSVLILLLYSYLQVFLPKKTLTKETPSIII